MLLSTGLVATSVSAFGPPPLGAVHIPLMPSESSDSSLRVLYGQNGVGKTTVLRAIDDALRGVAADDRELFVNVEVGHPGIGWGLNLLRDIVMCARRALAAPTEELEALEDEFLSLPELDSDALGVRVAAHMDRLRFDMYEIARRSGLGEDLLPAPVGLDLSLRAAGSDEKPKWVVYVSAVPAPNSPLDEKLRSLSETSAIGADAADLDASLARIEPDNPTMTLPLEGLRHSIHSDVGRRDWVPVCLARIGTIDAGRSQVSVISASDDVQAAAQRSIDDLGRRLPFASGSNFSVEIDEDLVEEAENRSRRASVLAAAFLGCPFQLSLRLSDPAEWLSRSPLEWVHIDDRFPNAIPLSQLSGGQARWSAAAIDIASAQVGDGLPVVLLVDEPERSMHPALMSHLATELRGPYRMDVSETSDLVNTVVATHSPAFLNLTGVPLLHVTRRTDGCAQVNPVGFENLTDPSELAAQLGCTLADVLNLIERWIIVEGRHDELILQTIFRDELVDRHWQIVPMRGARNAAAAVSNQFLLGYSSADLVVVLDGLAADTITMWDAAVSEHDQGRHSSARHKLETVRDSGGAESRYLGEAGLEALGRGNLSRVHAVGLSRPDLLNYLNPADLGLSESWDQLDKRFRREHSGRTSGTDRKIWLRKQGADLSDSSLIRAAGDVEDIGDLAQLLNVG